MKTNKLIDHTLLKADASLEKINKLCEEARTYDFASVCVNSSWVAHCAKQLAGSDVKVCAVVGFPLGAMSSEAKAFETSYVMANGGSEVDMVIPIGALKDNNDALVKSDIEAVVKAANGNCVKVILETCLLTDEEIVRACNICVEAKATFVKTSTGFNSAGANPRVVKLMKDTVQDNAEVKAAGGVRSIADLNEMVAAGATRIGTSGGVSLMEEKAITTGY